jgi:hypothetical protein
MSDKKKDATETGTSKSTGELSGENHWTTGPRPDLLTEVVMYGAPPSPDPGFPPDFIPLPWPPSVPQPGVPPVKITPPAQATLPLPLTQADLQGLVNAMNAQYTQLRTELQSGLESIRASIRDLEDTLDVDHVRDLRAENEKLRGAFNLAGETAKKIEAVKMELAVANESVRRAHIENAKLAESNRELREKLSRIESALKDGD